ncbi:MAG: ABC-2 family transporter protein [Candidatus Daviesbacteria bacterium]|nr:ABC-2 family transporter protein [Candidatus Daviesbacteria bacterium]
MSKYLAVFQISWEQGLVYRLNFFLWRVRTVIQFLLVYFIWWTVFQSTESVFGYNQSSILTYIMAAALIRAIVLSSRATDLTNQINDGSVANFLTKPLGFIRYYLARDFADKLLNISFVIAEITLIILLLKPKIIFQDDLAILALFVVAAILGIILNFTIGFLISLTSFWVENSWGPLFLIMILLEGLGGGLFPIDILPSGVFNILMLTPFPYLIYFPSKIYLGTMHINEVIFGFMVLSVWIAMLWQLMLVTLRAGFRHYTVQGH